MTGTLYVCATPIGNLEDASFRLVRTLREVDLVAAEDTRHSLQLLRHFGIATKLISYHRHSSESQSEFLLAELLAGKNIALVSDAGTPGISDPGEQIIASCIRRGISVEAIPGPSACITALVLAGLPTARFAFEGFLPRGKTERREALATLLSEERTMVFYEAPHRLAETLGDMLRVLGDRRAALARELTKLHEEISRGTLQSLHLELAEARVRGECVIIVEGRAKCATADECFDVDGEALVAKFLEQGFTAAQASRHAAKVSGLSRAALYQVAVRLREGQK